jgi:chromate transporter
MVTADENPLPVSRKSGLVCFGLFGTVFASLEIARRVSSSANVRLLDAFYRTGSLVFGGGHVVLPLLNEAVVRAGWVTYSDFLAGYGAAQTIPGPLFTFAAYLGFAARTSLHGIKGALLCTVCIFLPGLLLAAAAAPFWSWLRGHKSVQFAVSGVNAVVVGLLFSALFRAVFSTLATHQPSDFLITIAAFCVLISTRVSPVIVVLGVASVEALVAFFVAG